MLNQLPLAIDHYTCMILKLLAPIWTIVSYISLNRTSSIDFSKKNMKSQDFAGPSEPKSSKRYKNGKFNGQ